MNWNEIKVGEKYNDHHDEVVEVLYKNEKYNTVLIVDQDEKFALYDERAYVEWTELKPPLPETGLLVSKRGEIAFRTGGDCGYGFTVEGYYVEDNTQTWGFENDIYGWRPATEDDEKKFKELLEKECIRRYGEDWRNVKIKEHANSFTKNLNRGIFVPIVHKRDVLNKNGSLFHFGKWAKKIEEEPKEVIIDGVTYVPKK